MPPRGVEHPILPLFSTSVSRKYHQIEGTKPRLLSQQESIGTQEAMHPKRRELPLRGVSGPTAVHSLRPYKQGGMLPTHDGPRPVAQPFTGLQPLGFQAKPRYNGGNYDFKQKPLIRGPFMVPAKA